jgi:hypothetical protein
LAGRVAFADGRKIGPRGNADLHRVSNRAVEDLAQQCCRGMRARETVSENEVHCLF